MIEVENVSKRFGAKTAVDGVSFTARPGEIFGYLGPNGAGKSTTIKLIAGLLRPDAGRVLVGGRDIANEPLAVKRMLGYVPETGAIYDKLTALEYLQFIAGLYGLPPAGTKSKALELLGHFQLTGEADQRIASFSKGMRQKVMLAAALIHNPQVIILDEPLSGLDANAAIVIKGLLRRLAAEGRTVLYSSHILEVVQNLCDRVAILNQGRLVAQGTVAEICREFGREDLESAFQAATGAADAAKTAAALTESLGTAG